jgi:nucleoside-diphosphate-sugar epimerase
MKKAIISGATGLCGSYLAKYLINRGVDVLCLGRTPFNELDLKTQEKLYGIHFISIDMKNILSLQNKLRNISWMPGDNCIFYNFAWGGKKKLSDGSFQSQFNNAIYSANALSLAKKIGCKKFINVGTIEETFAENFLNNRQIYDPPNKTQINYTIAKLASRDMCKIISYLEKIDYVHTRLSVPISLDLNVGGYISSVFAKIKNGKNYDEPKNKQLFDIILLEDMAEAYYLIGKDGKNNSDYFIGTSCPKKLNEYFNIYSSTIKKSSEVINRKNNVNKMFKIDDLVNDTGFKVSNSFEDFMVKFF